MAGEETLTFRLNAVGGDGVERDLGELEMKLSRLEKSTDKVNRSARTFGDRMRQATNPTNALSRALKVTSTRMVLATGRLGLFAGAFVVLSPLIFEAIAGLTAFGALAGAIGVVGLGAFGRFNDTVNIAGSAANHLAEAWADFSWSFSKAMAPGADMILQALADALVRLGPVIEQITPGLTAFATSMAVAIGHLAGGLVGLGPDVNKLFMDMAPALPEIADAIVDIVAALLELAQDGIPAMVWGINAFRDVVVAIKDASNWMDGFINAKGTWHDLKAEWEELTEQANWLAGAVEDVYNFFAKDPAATLWGWVKEEMIALTDWLIDRINEFVDALNWVNPFGDPLNRIEHIGPQDPLEGMPMLGAAPPALAIPQLGATPPQIPRSKRGSGIPGVRPDQRLGPHPFQMAPNVVIPWTWNMDGKTVAKGVHRQGVKKKSTR